MQTTPIGSEFFFEVSLRIRRMMPFLVAGEHPGREEKPAPACVLELIVDSDGVADGIEDHGDRA